MKKRVKIIYASGRLRRIKNHSVDPGAFISVQGIDVDIQSPLACKPSVTSIRIYDIPSVNLSAIQDNREGKCRYAASYPKNIHEWVSRHGTLEKALSHCQDF